MTKNPDTTPLTPNDQSADLSQFYGKEIKQLTQEMSDLPSGRVGQLRETIKEKIAQAEDPQEKVNLSRILQSSYIVIVPCRNCNQDMMLLRSHYLTLQEKARQNNVMPSFFCHGCLDENKYFPPANYHSSIPVSERNYNGSKRYSGEE